MLQLFTLALSTLVSPGFDMATIRPSKGAEEAAIRAAVERHFDALRLSDLEALSAVWQMEPGVVLVSSHTGEEAGPRTQPLGLWFGQIQGKMWEKGDMTINGVTFESKHRATVSVTFVSESTRTGFVSHEFAVVKQDGAWMIVSLKYHHMPFLGC